MALKQNPEKKIKKKKKVSSFVVLFNRQTKQSKRKTLFSYENYIMVKPQNTKPYFT